MELRRGLSDGYNSGVYAGYTPPGYTTTLYIPPSLYTPGYTLPPGTLHGSACTSQSPGREAEKKPWAQEREKPMGSLTSCASERKKCLLSYAVRAQILPAPGRERIEDWIDEGTLHA